MEGGDFIVSQAVEQQDSSAMIQNILEHALGQLQTVATNPPQDVRLADIHKLVDTSDKIAERLNIERRGYDAKPAPREVEELGAGVHIPIIRLSDEGLWKDL